MSKGQPWAVDDYKGVFLIKRPPLVSAWPISKTWPVTLEEQSANWKISVPLATTTSAGLQTQGGYGFQLQRQSHETFRESSVSRRGAQRHLAVCCLDSDVLSSSRLRLSRRGWLNEARMEAPRLAWKQQGPVGQVASLAEMPAETSTGQPGRPSTGGRGGFAGGGRQWLCGSPVESLEPRRPGPPSHWHDGTSARRCNLTLRRRYLHCADGKVQPVLDAAAGGEDPACRALDSPQPRALALVPARQDGGPWGFRVAAAQWQWQAPPGLQRRGWRCTNWRPPIHPAQAVQCPAVLPHKGPNEHVS
ncbi:hypothetical protein PCL_02852 [Purpureocillium lilacinum]|uniref:Uncharacterized protein n=1 Tax=Purpureocillium lilacinum TaxID=33203 RepID=A0A2U3DZ17_PURLI|nr:hypothetical protein Purlil1_6873 [Purpureocillium lilacinum]PWI67498.1 hypothetical protein PCL_02852 [Purpureocillium lilacinum]